jgi:YihY family inner membrane protein
MRLYDSTRQKLDNLQSKHPFLGFPYAVIWKYGDDKAGYLAALLTYYGFLSLFPLLLLVTTLTGIAARRYPHMQDTIITGVTSYFPGIGNQLYDHINSLHQTGPALLAGVLFLIYGARGIASAFRYTTHRVWHVDRKEDLAFPHSLGNNIAIIVVGGFGFIFAAVATAAVATFQDNLTFRLLSVTVDVFILFWLFIALLKLSLPKHISLSHTWSGAFAAAIGLVILQTVGGLLLARQLKNLDALYSYFALSLGLLFWLYLQAQVMIWSLEISAVRSLKLWPRNLDGKLLKK